MRRPLTLRTHAIGVVRRLRFHARVLARRSRPALLLRQLVTGQRGTLPGLVIIGANKAGTTSLFAFLGQHPEVLPAITKEVHFFDFNYRRGLGWYRAHFLQPRHGARRVPCEATPSYLDHPLVPARAARDLPEARFVALLRDPVTRAYSHYWHERHYGRITAPFEEALRGEIERLEEERRTGRDAPWDFRRFLRRSVYAPSLRRWLQVIPRERLLVLRAEVLQRDPLGQLDRVCAFAGLAPWSGYKLAPRNVGQYERAIPEGLGEVVREVLADDAREVNGLLGEALL